MEELLAQITSSEAKVLLVHNALTESQRKVLAEVTGCTVLSFTDDFVAC
jgi:50S ribosomal subunit-associated GTPase HflX